MHAFSAAVAGLCRRGYRHTLAILTRSNLLKRIAFAAVGLAAGQGAMAVPERATIRAFLYEGTTTVQTPVEACEKWRDGFNRTYGGIASMTGPRTFEWDPPGKYASNQPTLRCLFSSVQYGQVYPVDWRGTGQAICRAGTYFDPATLNCDCLPGFVWSETTAKCEVQFHQNHDKPKNACGFGNPIYPLTGAKRSTEVLGEWFSNWSVALEYDTRSKLPGGAGAFRYRPAESFGDLWESSAHRRLVVQNSGSTWVIQASRGSHQWVTFTWDGSRYKPDSDIADGLASATGGWRYTDAAARSQETYNSSGLLANIAFAHGEKLVYSYSDSTTPTSVAPSSGLLIKIENQFGRSVRFEYERPAGISIPRIARTVDPSGQVIGAAYDDLGNLSSLTWPDGTVRNFLYEQSSIPWALTGVVDENGDRFSKFTYDTEGRALSTEYAGETNKYSVSYASPPQWLVADSADSAGLRWRSHSWLPPQGVVVTTPNNNAIQLGVTLVNGMPRIATRSQPAGAGCDASTSSLAYDANGNVAGRTDFNANRICHAHDLARNLETARLEGLGSTEACPADIAAYAIPASASQRKTTTEWHPQWSLPARRAEPGKITTFVYNNRPGSDGTIVTCAPATATLPDGSRIAALCRKLEQATTDATGTLGFNATPIGPTRSWNYTYNEFGQVLTARDPLNHLTTYAYHGGTTAEYTRGDLQSITNPASQVTQYTHYDKSGRLLRSVDANGTATSTTYTPRGWVGTVTITPLGGTQQVTTYDYDGVGQLKKATLPDGTTLEYTYDAAHRLTGVKDAAGNSVTYTLDSMGNRTADALKDATGTLIRNITRVYDALNRIQSAAGGAP